MASTTIRSGTKITIKLADANATNFFIWNSTFEKKIGDVAILVSAPLHAGKPVIFDLDEKIIVTYSLGQEWVEIEGYVDDLVTHGHRRFLKVRTISQHKRSDLRADVRIPAQLKGEMAVNVWHDDGTLTKDFFNITTGDISNGGIAAYMNTHLETGTVVILKIYAPGGKVFIEANGTACWTREAEKGSGYKQVCGIKFILDDPVQKDKIIKFVARITSLVSKF